ncbi:MAG: tail fiber protein [Pseudomonadota bacterium]|nr:tail fiber protein [Pseudomonadota bacterium]
MNRLLRLALAAGLIVALAGATSSPNKGYLLPTPNGDNNLWGTMLDGDLTTIDQNLAGIATVPLSGQQVTATAAQAANLVQKLTGALTQNVIYQLPSAQGFWIIDNETTGSFAVTVATVAPNSAGTAVAQTEHLMVESDGTNVYAVTPGLSQLGNLSPAQGGVPSGAIMWYTSTTIPNGYLAGDGSCQSTASYPGLSILGTSYGAGCPAGTVRLPDCRARVLAGYDSGNATGRLTANTAQGVSASALGNNGGEQSHTLVAAEIPALNFTGTTAATAASGNTGTGALNVNYGNWLNTGSSYLVSSTGSQIGATNFGTIPSLTVSVNVPSVAVTGSSSNTGGGTHNVTQPTLIAQCMVKT